MKVVIESESMVMNYEPLEPGEIVEVSDTVGQAWIESGRASLAPKKQADPGTAPAGKDSDVKDDSKKDDDKATEASEAETKAKKKNASQKKADKEPKETR